MKTAEDKARELYPVPDLFKGAVTHESLQQEAFLKGYKYAKQQPEQWEKCENSRCANNNPMQSGYCKDCLSKMFQEKETERDTLREAAEKVVEEAKKPHHPKRTLEVFAKIGELEKALK